MKYFLKKQVVLITLSVCIVACILAIFLQKPSEPEPPRVIYPPIEWNQITVGENNQEDVIKLWGKPDDTAVVNGYESYYYDSRKEVNWDGVYVLFDTEPESIVQSILLTYDFEHKQEYRFQKMIVENGKPDMILWGGKPYVRFLFWLNKGLGTIRFR